jgi:type IX secretion system PorP/SprF family membrane protein
MNKVYFLLISLAVYTSSIAQDPVFNQTDNSRNYLNPAYIGTEKSFSADINYRNQWPELTGNYKTLAVQLNQYLGKGNGVSIHFVNDNAANTLKKTEIGLGYAKQFSIASKHHVSVGTQIYYFQKIMDWDKLTFGNMIDPRRGFVYPGSDSLIYEPITGVDFNIGLLYYNKYFFVGYVTKHIAQPNESFFGNNVRLPIRHGIQIGGKIKWNDITFIPSFRLFQQATFQTMFASLKVKFDFIEIDAGYQFKNGVYGGLGYSSGHFNVGYNYTLSTSKLGYSASTHEIRMGCDFTLFKKENEHFFDF